MIPGLSGSLLSHEVLAQIAPTLRGLLDEEGREAARRRIRAWHLPLRAQLGPVLPLRAIFDLLGEPLLTGLGYHRLRPALAAECHRERCCAGTPRWSPAR